MVEGKMEFLAQERETTGTGTAVIDIAGCTIGSTAVLAGILAFTGEKGCGETQYFANQIPSSSSGRPMGRTDRHGG
jgi:hypothetical protein